MTTSAKGRAPLLLAAAMVILGAGGAHAQVTPAPAVDPLNRTIKPFCVENSRDCLLATAKLYIDGLIGRDGSKIPFAPTVHDSEHGVAVDVPGWKFQDAMKKSPPTLISARNVRYVVDLKRQEAVAYFLIGLTLPKKGADGKADGAGVMEAWTVHRSQRFKIVDGFIQEMEVLIDMEQGTTDGQSGWPDQPAAATAPAAAPTVKPLCTSSARDCLVKTANAYLDGLGRHDGSRIPFVANVKATEQGRVAVTDEKAFRVEVDSSSAITAIRNVRLSVDEQTGQVAGFLLIDVAIPAQGETAAKPPYTVRRAERFKIVRGLITEVEIINYVDPKLAGLAQPLWPD